MRRYKQRKKNADVEEDTMEKYLLLVLEKWHTTGKADYLKYSNKLNPFCLDYTKTSFNVSYNNFF